MELQKESTVQDLLISDLLETGDEVQPSETVALMDFYRNNAPLTQDQVKASFLLQEMGLADIAVYAQEQRKRVTPFKVFNDVLSKLTLADRIKGNAKLSHLLKANANPAGTALKPEDVQAKPMKKSEIDR